MNSSYCRFWRAEGRASIPLPVLYKSPQLLGGKKQTNEFCHLCTTKSLPPTSVAIISAVSCTSRTLVPCPPHLPKELTPERTSFAEPPVSHSPRFFPSHHRVCCHIPIIRRASWAHFLLRWLLSFSALSSFAITWHLPSLRSHLIARSSVPSLLILLWSLTDIQWSTLAFLKSLFPSPPWSGSPFLTLFPSHTLVLASGLSVCSPPWRLFMPRSLAFVRPLFLSLPLPPERGLLWICFKLALSAHPHHFYICLSWFFFHSFITTWYSLVFLSVYRVAHPVII